jgi:hypothetical protein
MKCQINFTITVYLKCDIIFLHRVAAVAVSRTSQVVSTSHIIGLATVMRETGDIIIRRKRGIGTNQTRVMVDTRVIEGEMRIGNIGMKGKLVRHRKAKSIQLERLMS